MSSGSIESDHQEGPPREPTVGGWRMFIKRMWSSRLARIAGLIILIEVVVALSADLIAPFDPTAIAGPPLSPPGTDGFVLGTDDLGRDLLSRVIHGTGLALLEGIVVVVIAYGIAIPLGLMIVEFPRLDGLVMRTNDALLAFPGILLALVFAAVLGPSLRSVLIAVGLASVAPSIVLVRATARVAAAREFVTAARSMRASHLRIAFVHLLPTITPPLIVAITFRISTAILISTTLSFLGLGAQPPTPEWGAMLANGRDLLLVAPHVSAFPGLAIVVTVLAFNLLGDGLRDVLDPRTRSRGTAGLTGDPTAPTSDIEGLAQ